jgi:phage terminase large subunit GpA-like protein
MSLRALQQHWNASWKPPQKYLPSQWAERKFILPAENNAEPGPFHFARTPYLEGIVDSIVEPGVEEIVFLKPTRIGGTTASEIILGYWIDNDPGPCLTVLPGEDDVRDEIKSRLRPMLELSLAHHISKARQDNTQECIRLDTMPLHFGWSGSPASLARLTCRYIRFDEVDKFEPFSGKEADPISLGKERAGTYGHRRRIYITSTPTTRQGQIWLAWLGCGDKRHFYVPCPHCGTFQVLVWPQLKWPKLPITDKVKRADEIEQGRLAWYECIDPACRGRIEESHKPKMFERAAATAQKGWLSHDSEDRPVQTIDKDGKITGDRPRSSRVGFWINGIYSPWRKLWEIAGKWIRAKGDLAATMHFRNSWMAETFEQTISTREPSQLREKIEFARTLGMLGQRRVIPPWAIFILATADVQMGHVYWQIDAWGYDLQSKRLDYGVCMGGGTDDNAILAALQKTHQEVFSPAMPLVTSDGLAVPVPELIVDAKFKTAVVTQFAQTDPYRVRISEGDSKFTGAIAGQRVRGGVVLWTINTLQSKDTLDRLIGDADPEQWQLFDGADDDYCTQLTSEQKVLDRKSGQLLWQKKTSGAPNHYWDCSANSAAIAVGKGAAAPKPLEAPRPPETKKKDQGGWMRDRPDNWTQR